MEVTIKIDHREGKIKELLGYQQLSMFPEYENLEVGDVQIIVRDKDESYYYIFERKTLPDLVASITDGRYKNQKANLMQFPEPKNIYYIIEGDVDYLKCEQKIKGMIINTIIRDNISIFNTKSTKETVYLIYDIYNRIVKDPTKYLHLTAPSANNNTVTTLKSINTNIKGNPSETDVFRAMLCQIPTVSIKTAQAITDRYKTYKELYNCLYNLEYDEKLNMLKGLITCDNKGKSRRLSGTSIINILKYLLGDDTNHGEGSAL